MFSDFKIIIITIMNKLYIYIYIYTSQLYVTICPSYQLTPQIRYRLNLSLARRKETMNVSCPLTCRPAEHQLKKTIRHKLVPPPSVPSRSDASNNKKEKHRSSTSTKSTSTSQQRRQQLVFVQVKFFSINYTMLHPMRNVRISEQIRRVSHCPKFRY